MAAQRWMMAMLIATSGFLTLVPAGVAAAASLRDQIAARAQALEDRLITWRRDIHAHPELSNREFRTSALVAAHLKELGFDEVRTGIAHTGVVGVLKGGRPGPIVALRADMDALPVAERVDLPFASKVKSTYNGREVGVMHACGHDAHTAILMAVAEVLSGLRETLPGTVVFIFQPAEEGAPAGEEGGARLMLAEGLFDGPDAPQAIFGLHVWPGPPGEVSYRAEGTMAAADMFRIAVTGAQTHGSMPWRGVDPIIVSAQIMLGLQLIPSRQLDVTRAPAVISVGSIHGGVRNNIIPERVEMVGTIRTFDEDMRKDVHARIERTARNIAEGMGARAEVSFGDYAPVTYNDPELTARMIPTLEWAAEGRVSQSPRVMAAEDFSYFQKRIPGLYVRLGVNREGVPAEDAAPNHSPYFYVNEAALITGVRTMAALAVDYLQAAQ